MNPLANNSPLDRNIAELKKMYSDFQKGKPVPEIDNVLRLCGSRDPKSIFYELCRQRGVDPNTILSRLR